MSLSSLPNAHAYTHSTHPHTHAHTTHHTHTHVQHTLIQCTHIHAHPHAHTCTHTQTYTPTYTHTHTHSHAHRFVTHTHTHTHTLSTSSVRTVCYNGLTSRQHAHYVERPLQMIQSGKMAPQPHGLSSSDSLSPSSFTAVPHSHITMIILCNVAIQFCVILPAGAPASYQLLLAKVMGPI